MRINERCNKYKIGVCVCVWYTNKRKLNYETKNKLGCFFRIWLQLQIQIEILIYSVSAVQRARYLYLHTHQNYTNNLLHFRIIYIVLLLFYGKTCCSVRFSLCLARRMMSLAHKIGETFQLKPFLRLCLHATACTPSHVKSIRFPSKAKAFVPIRTYTHTHTHDANLLERW